MEEYTKLELAVGKMKAYMIHDGRLKFADVPEKWQAVTEYQYKQIFGTEVPKD